MSGRKTSVDVIPGRTALSVGMPDKTPPKGWKWYSLSEVAEMATGHTPSRRHPEYWGGDIPWISVADARPYHGKTISSTKEYTNELGIKKSAAVILPKDTVCLSRTGSIGYSIILGKPMATSQGFVNWICSEKLVPRFLQLLFVAEYSFLHSISEGVAHTTIYFPAAKAFHVCLPSYDEQLQIIANIEELFSELDKGIEQLRTAEEQLKIYQHSVLKWSFEGKLTNKDLKGCELPKEWKYDFLGNVSEMCLGKMLDKSKNKGTFQPYLRNINVRWGAFELEGLDQMKFEESEYERYSLKRGDLVICEGGEPGRCAIWNNDSKMMIQKALHRVRVSEVLNVRFLFYFFRLSALDGTLSRYFTGTTIKHLTGKELKKVKLPIPPLVEQNKIVEIIESRLSVADKFEETISNSLHQAEALKQSILKKAFEGKTL